MQKVMITGAGGFLGRHLCKMLESDGYEVVRFYHGELDITDRTAVADALRSCRPDVVVNCAAISQPGHGLQQAGCSRNHLPDDRSLCLRLPIA